MEQARQPRIYTLPAYFFPVDYPPSYFLLAGWGGAVAAARSDRLRSKQPWKILLAIRFIVPRKSCSKSVMNVARRARAKVERKRVERKKRKKSEWKGGNCNGVWAAKSGGIENSFIYGRRSIPSMTRKWNAKSNADFGCFNGTGLCSKIASTRRKWQKWTIDPTRSIFDSL